MLIKKLFVILFSSFLSYNLLTITVIAQPKNLKEGVYSFNDLNLSSNATHTIKNNSETEYAFMMVFDSNQIAQQLMGLTPNSSEYILVPFQPGYQMLIVTNEEITIS